MPTDWLSQIDRDTEELVEENKRLRGLLGKVIEGIDHDCDNIAECKWCDGGGEELITSIRKELQ